MSILPNNQSTGNSHLDIYGLNQIKKYKTFELFGIELNRELSRRADNFLVEEEEDEGGYAVSYFDLRCFISLMELGTKPLRHRVMFDNIETATILETVRKDSEWILIEASARKLYDAVQLADSIANEFGEKLVKSGMKSQTSNGTHKTY